MISILIPLYNGIEFLEQSLNSVINQTYNEWEVIIGINGHQFNSLIEQKANSIKENIAKNDNRIRIIYYNTNGKSATLNAMKIELNNYIQYFLSEDLEFLDFKVGLNARAWKTVRLMQEVKGENVFNSFNHKF